MGGATLPDYEAASRRRQMLHTTYLYLAVGVAGCMAGAWFGSHYLPFLKMFFSAGMLGWIAVLVLINLVPSFSLAIAEKRPRLAVLALGFNGFISGLALAPLVFLALISSGAAESGAEGADIVSTALIVTAAIFASITGYVHLNKSEFKMSRAIMSGLFGFALVCVPVTMVFQSTIVVMLSSLAVGLLGAYQLASGTSKIVNDENFNSPAYGSLILFAGVFNIFNAVLRLVLLGGRR